MLVIKSNKFIHTHSHWYTHAQQFSWQIRMAKT